MALIFISYRNEDMKWRDNLYSLLKNPNTEIKDVPIQEREDFRGTSKEKITTYLKSLLLNASCLILLLGNNTHNGWFLNFEISVALSQKKPIGVIRIPDTVGGLPQILKNKKNPIVEWDTTEIKKMISDLFGRQS